MCDLEGEKLALESDMAELVEVRALVEGLVDQSSKKTIFQSFVYWVCVPVSQFLILHPIKNRQ
jgi:hypothetical protein